MSGLLSRRYCCLAGVAALLAQAAAPALAQGTYPTRAVRMVVPFAPAGGTDILARSLAQRMTESTAQQFVGRAHDEVTLLRAAAAYERATDWHTRRPPIKKTGNARRKPA